MAGIGEASAILTVTQFGFTFASRLADFIGDYKDAGNLMRSLSDEIEATSTPLQQLGELVNQNGLHNLKAVSDAMSLAERCKKTISEIRSILKMDDVSLDGSSNSKETALTKRDRLRWATLSKSRLEIPRAELGRLKTEMMLLYLTLMTMKSKSEEDQKRFANGIPGLAKKLKWANARYDELVRQEGESSHDGSSHDGSSHDEDFLATTRPDRLHSRKRLAKEHERKGLEDYREFLQKQSAERKEKMLQQELALQERKRQQQKEEEEKKRKEIEDAAVIAYKIKIKEQEEKMERDKKQVQEGFEKLLKKVGIEDDKIGQVLDQLEPPTIANQFFVDSTENPAQVQPEPEYENNAAGVVKRQSVLTRILRRARRTPDASLMPSISYDHSGILASPTKVKKESSILEAWVISHWANSILYAPISGQMLSEMLDAQKRPRKEKPLLQRFALLDGKYQDSIVKLCRDRSSTYRCNWMLVYLNEVREWKKSGRWKRAKGFTHIQVVLRQRRHPLDDIVEVREVDDPIVNPHDGEDDPHSRVSNSTPNAPKPGPKGSSDFQSAIHVSPGGNHDQKPETSPRRRRYWYKGRSDASKGPLLAELIDELVEITNNFTILRPMTVIFGNAIDRRALVESGYKPFEIDDKFVIDAGLSDVELDKLYERSKSIRGIAAVDENAGDSGDVTRRRRVTWDIPESGVSHADDLLLDGGPKRPSFTQPGPDGFSLSRLRSWSPPFSGELADEYPRTKLMRGFSRSRDSENLRAPFYEPPPPPIPARNSSSLNIQQPPAQPFGPHSTPAFAEHAYSGASSRMPYSNERNRSRPFSEDSESYTYHQPRRLDTQEVIIERRSPRNERADKYARQSERDLAWHLESGRFRNESGYGGGRARTEERDHSRARSWERGRDRLRENDYGGSRDLNRSDRSRYHYPSRRVVYYDYSPPRRSLSGSITRKDAYPPRSRNVDLDNSSDDDYFELFTANSNPANKTKTSTTLPSRNIISKCGSEDSVSESDSAIIEKQLALYREPQDQNQNQSQSQNRNTSNAASDTVEPELEGRPVETESEVEDVGPVSSKSSSSVVSGSTEEIVRRY